MRPRRAVKKGIHARHLLVHHAGEAGAHVCLQDDLGANALLGKHERRVANDPHYLVPFALDLGEHGIGPIREARLPDDLHDLGDLGGA